jgi:hypothetical protein
VERLFPSLMGAEFSRSVGDIYTPYLRPFIFQATHHLKTGHLFFMGAGSKNPIDCCWKFSKREI